MTAVQSAELVGSALIATAAMTLFPRARRRGTDAAKNDYPVIRPLKEEHNDEKLGKRKRTTCGEG